MKEESEFTQLQETCEALQTEVCPLHKSIDNLKLNNTNVSGQINEKAGFEEKSNLKCSLNQPSAWVS